MSLPSNMKKVIPSAGGNLINYDYVDIANGTGVSVFYGGMTRTATETTYSLSNNTFYAAFNGTQGYGSQTAYEWSQNVNASFQTTLNLPRTMNGTIIANVPWGLQVITGTIRGFASCAILKTSGSTTTSLASASSAILQQTGTARIYRTEAIPLAVTKTTFKKGDIIKFAVEIWSSPTEDGRVFSGALGHDPMNRTGDKMTDATITQLSLRIPFILDI